VRHERRPFTVVIVDDEPPARRTLQLLLAAQGDFHVAGEAGNGIEALELIDRLRPDLLFLDVQMPGLDGFDVLRHLGGRMPAGVVFVTAWDQYALRAFEAHALDYLLKPFTDERFGDVLARARKALADRDLSDVERRLTALIEGVNRSQAWTRPIVLHDGARTFVVPPAEIEWIQAQDYCIRVHAGSRQPLVRQSLKTIQAVLNPDTFLRVHRSAIVNLEHVREVRSLPSGDQELVMASGTVVRLSRTFRTAFEVRLADASITPRRA